jgi:DNA-binding MarR family transcriptional regulator
VLIRCVEAKQISHGHLAEILGRDKGMVTRFVNGLEAKGLVKREINRRDRRYSVILPTGKGKRRASELALVFASVRKELFAGILGSDITRLSSVLPRLRRNALAMGTSRKTKGLPRRRRSDWSEKNARDWESRQPSLGGEPGSLGSAGESVAVSSQQDDERAHEPAHGSQLSQDA